MKPKLVILLCLMLSACASQQIKPTILPEVTFTYEPQMNDEEKTSLNNAIMDAISCDLPNTTITINIKEYSIPDTLNQYMGWPVKGIYILAYVTVSALNQEPYSFNMNGRITTGGLISVLSRDIHDAELNLAYKIWKKICRIYNKGTTQNTP